MNIIHRKYIFSNRYFTDTISISMFNKGLAGKIFGEVKKAGPKVVMKNDTVECVLISPEEYLRLMEEVNDTHLIQAANERMESYDESETIPAEDVFK